MKQPDNDSECLLYDLLYKAGLINKNDYEAMKNQDEKLKEIANKTKCPRKKFLTESALQERQREYTALCQGLDFLSFFAFQNSST